MEYSVVERRRDAAKRKRAKSLRGEWEFLFRPMSKIPDTKRRKPSDCNKCDNIDPRETVRLRNYGERRW